MYKNMTKKQIAKKLGLQVWAVLVLPLIAYIIISIMSFSRGYGFYNIFTYSALRALVRTMCTSLILSLGVSFQMKFGRFDFSGGAVVVVSAVVCGLFADATGANVWVMMLISALVGVVLSTLVGTVYSFLKIPIIVCALGMAYLFEAIPGLLLSGSSMPSLVYRVGYMELGTFPLILVPTAIVSFLFFTFDRYTAVGRQGILLLKNQAAAVNIGINERKVIVITFIFSGLIYGIGGSVYVTQNIIEAMTTPLQTVSVVLNNMIASLIGYFLSRWIDNFLGVVIGAFTMALVSRGLYSVGFTGGTYTIFMGIMIGIFVILAGFWDDLKLITKMVVDKISYKMTAKFKKS